MSHVRLPGWLAPALGKVVAGGLSTQRLAKRDWLLCYLYSYGSLPDLLNKFTWSYHSTHWVTTDFYLVKGQHCRRVAACCLPLSVSNLPCRLTWKLIHAMPCQGAIVSCARPAKIP